MVSEVDMTYKRERIDLDENEHGDAAAVNALVVAIVKKDRNLADAALKAVLALWPDMTEADRFIHLTKVLGAVGTNQAIAHLELTIPTRINVDNVPPAPTE